MAMDVTIQNLARLRKANKIVRPEVSKAKTYLNFTNRHILQHFSKQVIDFNMVSAYGRTHGVPSDMLEAPPGQRF